MSDRFTNRLINETSPYLLQHAHNPVDWFAWGAEARAKAQAENKVILVSIGYSACHWCHVMERESFENEAVAQIMNDSFVNIKIDREERPDLDHIYMDAVQAISGSGGWPLNVFLTPEGKPFFGGTYFPPVKAFNRSSWTEVLQGISQAWKERKDEIVSQAENLTDHLQKSGSLAQGGINVLGLGIDKTAAIEHCHAMFMAIMKTADREWGGFGKAPKFPQTFTIQYLFQYYYFTGSKDSLKQALLSVDKMLQGGIYDHVGGGLARYSTDNEWLVPHFEKMLYDNALLINILCDAYQLTSDKKYETAIKKTISFLQQELLSSEGGFYAALDADSEGKEGKYYVWQKAAVDDLLREDAGIFCEFFDITQDGNWEQENILRTLKDADEFVTERSLDKELFLTTIQRGLDKLFVERSKRTRPSLDDKIILGWNALVLKSISKAAITLQDADYLQVAMKGFDFLETNFKKDNSLPELLHTYKNGLAKYPAFLDDYAYFVATAIQLYKATFKAKYLEIAKAYCEYVIENFSDDESIFFFFTNKWQEDVIVRKKEIYDGAIPSGNSIMAENLYYLSIIFDKVDWLNRATNILETVAPMMIKYPGSFSIWAGLFLQHTVGSNEIAVIGTDFESPSKKILLKFIPNMIIMGAEKENDTFPLLANKPDNALVQIYLCKNYACLAPFSDTDSVLLEIDKTNKLST